MAVRIFPRVSATLPTGGAVLREPYARGLVAAFAPGVTTGGLTDLVSGLTLTPLNGAGLGTGGATAGLVCNANSADAEAVCPAWLKLASPITLVARMSFLGTPTANCNLFGVTSNNTATTPFLAYSLGISAAGQFRLAYSDGATFREWVGDNPGYPRAPSVGCPITVVGLFTATGTTIYFGPDEGDQLGGNCNPTYSASSMLAMGHYATSARNPAVCFEYGLIYNRRLIPSELKLFRDHPYHWLRPAGAYTFALGAPAVVLTTVPNVVGMTTAAADAALVAVGLVTGTLTTATHPTAPAGTVISQSPTAGSSVTPGSAVALVISLGPLDQSIKPAAIVEVELDGVDNGWTALTLDVLRAPGIVIRRGIDETRPDARVASTGTASFGLNNSASNSVGLLGYYSPHHVNLRPGFGLGIRCRVSLQSPDLVWRVQFLGRLDAIDPLPGAHGARQVLVTAVDWLDEAARWRLTPAIGEQIDQSWDAVLTAILAEMPVQPAAISLNGGSETWPYALDTSEVSQQTALAEFVKLAHSEYGLIYQRADGTLRAEDRHFRMTTTTAVWTLTDAEFQDLELPSTRDDLLNTVRVTTHPRTVSPDADVVVYDQVNDIELAAGETKMLMGSYRDPVTGDPIGATEIQPQVVGTDIIANTAADGTGTNVSSSMGVVMEAGQSGVRFDVTNGTGAPAFLTTLRLIGKGIYDHGATVHEATDTASISLHGEHALDYDMPYQVRQDVGQAAADYILAKYKDPLAQAHSLTVIARTPELLLQILTRDISDRITLSETVTGADDTYFINAVELTIHAAGHASARYTLTPADDPATLAGYFILDISALDGPDILAPF